MPIGVALDPDQGLSADDELRLMRLAAELGYASAWTNSGPNATAFERCLRWHQASGLPTGISAVPASGNSPEFYAGEARKVVSASGGRFTLVVGSGQWTDAAPRMRLYLPQVRRALPEDAALYAAALGPLMLGVAGQLADGVALNWCTPEQIAESRTTVEASATSVGRPMPTIIQYIRTAVDDDASLAHRTVATAAARYLAFPAYRRHFERMGVAAELGQLDSADGASIASTADRVGASGTASQTRQRFTELSLGLDLPIVRVLVTRRGDFDSARQVLEACRPS